MRKSLFLGAITALLFVSPTIAADLPTKAPYTAPNSVFNWSGFYLEGHVTGLWPQVSPDGGIGLPGGKPSGWGGGAGLMALYQMQSGVVLGVKVDGDLRDASGTIAGGLASYKGNLEGTLRGIVGYTGVLPAGWLPYATFGISATKSDVTVATFKSTDTAIGGVAGGGMMMMLNSPTNAPLTPQWALFAEGLYDFAVKDVYTFGSTAVGAKTNGWEARGGLVLRL